MNRAERRRQQRQNAHEAKRAAKQLDADLAKTGLFDAVRATRDPAYMSELTRRKTAQMASWAKNGITRDDLKKAYDDGYLCAQKDLIGCNMRMFYGSMAIALHNIYGFAEKRTMRVLEETQKIMCEEFDADELFDRVKRETGITMVDVSDGGVFDD